MNSSVLHDHQEIKFDEKQVRKKKPIPRAPNKIVPIKCSDKVGKEYWDDKHKDLANFPAPMRMLITGRQDVGKTSLIKNIIIHARPRYKEVYLIHEDVDFSKEYDDLEPTDKLKDIPELDFWEHDGPYVKRCVIIDDLEYTGANRDRLRRLAVLFRYVSSHKGLSIILAHQSFFDVPVIVKKMSNVFIIYKPIARNELSMIENRVGMPPGMLEELFDTVATNFNDSICVDETKNTPAPLRLNLFEPIDINEIEKK